MTEDEFADVYHLLQSENPVFFTALNVDGLEVGAVHMALGVSDGSDPGELDPHPGSIASLVRRARLHAANAEATPRRP
jgi:hypothetical protein